jgi:hypothetical protein
MSGECTYVMIVTKTAIAFEIATDEIGEDILFFIFSYWYFEVLQVQ